MTSTHFETRNRDRASVMLTNE